MITLIDISKIVLDPDLQTRAGTSDDKIAEYRAAYERGDAVPPVVLFGPPTPGASLYWIAAGHHRLEAQRGMGRQMVESVLKEGGRKEALFYALSSNATHGLELTPADKRRAIKLLLKEFTEWRERGDREIARQLKLRHHDLVSTVRKEMIEAGEIEAGDRKVTRNGQVYTQKDKELSGGIRQIEETSPSAEGSQPSLLISTPAERSAKSGQGMYDRAEQHQAELKVCTPETAKAEEPAQSPATQGREPAPRCTSGDCPRLAVVKGLWCEEHDPSVGDLHELLDGLEKEAFTKDWSIQIEIVGKTALVSLVWALTKLPNAKVRAAVEIDDGSMLVVAFTDSLLGRTLCRFVSKQPKAAKASPKEDEGAEDSAPSKGWQHYNTPPELRDPLVIVSPIGLDPCHNSGSMLGARVTIDVDGDGLSKEHDWSAIAAGDLIVVNPPWCKVGPWVDRICEEAAKPNTQIVLVVRSATAAEWWQKAAKSCMVRCEIAGRVAYYKDGVPDTSPLDATTLFYWGPKSLRFAAVFGKRGCLSRFVPEDFYARATAELNGEAVEAKQRALPLATPSTPPAPTIERELLFKGTLEELGEKGLSKDHEPGLVDSMIAELRAATTREQAEAVWVRADELVGHNPESGDYDRLAEVWREVVGKVKWVKDPYATHQEEPKEKPLQLHEVLRQKAAGYQKEGHVVTFKVPGKKKPVSSGGVCSIIEDQPCSLGGVVREDNEPVYRLDIFAFDVSWNRAGKLLCTMVATEAEQVEEKFYLCLVCGAHYNPNAKKEYLAHCKEEGLSKLDAFEGPQFVELSYENPFGHVSHYLVFNQYYTREQYLGSLLRGQDQHHLWGLTDEGTFMFSVNGEEEGWKGLPRAFKATQEATPEGLYHCYFCSKNQPLLKMPDAVLSEFECNDCLSEKKPAKKLPKEKTRSMGVPLKRPVKKKAGSR